MSKRLVILGAGESGTGTALLGKEKGYDVFVSDLSIIAPQYKAELLKHNIAFEEGVHSEEKIMNAQVVVKSPGIPDKAPLVKKLHALQIPVISEIEFAAPFTNAKLIGITGSNGKTTTTLFTYHILKEIGLNVGLAGNIGQSFARQIVEHQFDYYVLELSSFQLDGIYSVPLHIAILLNITPDHLDRYEYKFENYIASKFRITKNLTDKDYFITNADDAVVSAYMKDKQYKAKVLPVSFMKELSSGAYEKNGEVVLSVNQSANHININDLPLKGKHNKFNMMSTFLVVKALGIDMDKALHVAKSFKNASHRLEFVRVLNQVEYINDSKATNVDSVFYALDAMTKPTVWIVGGVDKGNDYSVLDELVAKKVKTIICMGKDNQIPMQYFQKFNKSLVSVGSMDDAIKVAHQEAVKGDVVLLSPACASFDLFKNYEDRGDQFKQVVNQLV
jgi:UDP-N-acetylmuramoylalanine--D-glutamate ligase